MAEKPVNGLSRRERQIMDIIYAQGAATATEVVSALPDPPSKTAIRTLLRILEEKGHLKHVQRGREYVYQPIQPRLRAGRSAFQRVLQTFFDGSLEKAVAAHLADSSSNLATEDLKRLADLIHQARNKGK
ncbi:MAG: BlaI/MecI/CopY family transcriptional regulator [Planctomycetaceae bacterium]|nr:BlaI/MecI/CopY family transcriptional regulator [Planctomycetaceae bacterium]